MGLGDQGSHVNANGERLPSSPGPKHGGSFPSQLSLTQMLANREQRANNWKSKLTEFMANVRQCEEDQQHDTEEKYFECTAFSDEDSDGDQIDLFQHDLEEQEESDSSDCENLNNDNNPIKPH